MEIIQEPRLQAEVVGANTIRDHDGSDMEGAAADLDLDPLGQGFVKAQPHSGLGDLLHDAVTSSGPSAGS